MLQKKTKLERWFCKTTPLCWGKCYLLRQLLITGGYFEMQARARCKNIFNGINMGFVFAMIFCTFNPSYGG